MAWSKEELSQLKSTLISLAEQVHADAVRNGATDDAIEQEVREAWRQYLIENVEEPDKLATATSKFVDSDDLIEQTVTRLRAKPKLRLKGGGRKKKAEDESGNGKGMGRSGAKRHRKILRDNIQGITKPGIRRLARRAGVKRLSGMIYEETRGVLKTFLERVIRDAVIYCEHSRRKTVTSMDVVYSAKRQGRTLYGFGG